MFHGFDATPSTEVRLPGMIHQADGVVPRSNEARPRTITLLSALPEQTMYAVNHPRPRD
jgi:hypothetical protein